MPEITAAIIGGGIGGLAAGIALQRQGIEATVYEREPEIREAGAGITLWAGAIEVLRQLGLGGTLDDHAVAIEGAELCDPEGRPFPDLWLGSFVAEDSSTQPLCIHRATLQRALLDRLGPTSVVTAARAEAVVAGDGAGPSTVSFADGRSVTADVVVGADGIRSVVRQALFEGTAPVYAGQTVYRGVAPAGPAAARAPFVAIGTGTRFGWELLPHGEVYWFAGRFQPEHQADDPARRQEALMGVFGGWAPPVGELLAATPSERILRNDVYVVGPLDRWVAGTVALLGDAAHAVPPHVGHGACLAIEDAARLADELAGGGRPAQALARYEAARIPAVAPLFTRAQELAAGLQVGQLPTPTPSKP